MEDPGFPKRGRQTQKLGANLLFCHLFPKNCMKLKNGPRCGGVRLPPLNPPMNQTMARTDQRHKAAQCS